MSEKVYVCSRSNATHAADEAWVETRAELEALPWVKPWLPGGGLGTDHLYWHRGGSYGALRGATRDAPNFLMAASKDGGWWVVGGIDDGDAIGLPHEEHGLWYFEPLPDACACGAAEWSAKRDEVDNVPVLVCVACRRESKREAKG